MSPFVPTGYLTIDQAIDRVVDLKSGDTGPLLTEEEAAEVLRQLLYADRVTWVTITDYGTLIETPKHICGGEQWYEVLQSGRIKFAHGHVLSNPVSGRPLIPRDALEAAFEPDRAVKEEPQPEPGPSKESQDKKPSSRKHDAIDDALLKNRISNVLALARDRWPDPKRRPGYKPMAKELVRAQGKSLEFKSETVRKILAGTYSASQRLGISKL